MTRKCLGETYLSASTKSYVTSGRSGPLLVGGEVLDEDACFYSETDELRSSPRRILDR
jgi:hypothetical protein